MSPPSPFRLDDADPLENPSGSGVGDPLPLRPDRPWYATGVLLDAEDFQAEQLYHRSRLAAGMLSLGGCGTLAGLKVLWQPSHPASGAMPAREEEITVEPGLALDRRGRLIEVPRPACLRLGRWLAGLKEPLATSLLREHTQAGVNKRQIVADVFLRFLPIPRGYTPAAASGPFDASDAVQPSRIRDSYKLELVPRPGTMPPGDLLPLDPWAEVRAAATPEARWQKLQEVILAGAVNHGVASAAAGAGDSGGTTLQGSNASEADVSPEALFLARLWIPVVKTDAGTLTRPNGDDVTVRNDLRAFVLSISALAAWAGMPAPSTP